MLTARDSVEDRVAGLDAGADDYLVKPFAFAELLARLRALARRGDGERPAVLEVGDLRLDPATRRAWRGGAEIQLSTKEFALLETFMRRPGEVLSRLYLLEHAWDFAYENRSNIIDVYVRHLRRKIDGRSAGARSRRSAAPATGCGRTAVDDPRPDPRSHRGCVRAGDGGRARSDRLVPVLRVELPPRPLRSTASLQLRTARSVGARPRAGGSLASASGRAVVEPGETYAQLLDAAGNVLDATPPLGAASLLLSPADPARAPRRGVLCQSSVGAGADEPSRLLASPVDGEAVASSWSWARRRADRTETLASLATSC